MLNEKGFDQWAEDYEQSVALSDADDRYPFAGYRDILDTICRNVLSQGAKDVLDIGFGTGTLSAALYAQGCRIYGQDFSAQMLRLAQDRMPKATLFCGDFSQGLSTPLTQRTYDAIVATYSLHHLTDRQKWILSAAFFPCCGRAAASISVMWLSLPEPRWRCAVSMLVTCGMPMRPISFSMK